MVPGLPVLDRYYRELLNYFTRQVKDRDGAADIVQEAYARVLGVQQAGQPIREPRALLYRTARNLLIDRQRHQALRAPEDPQALDDMPAPVAQQPEEAYAAQQRVNRLVAAIEGLPPRCREAFVLHKLDGLSHAEVAAQMGISRNMVERHVMLAVLACRKSRDNADDAAARPPRGREGPPCD